MDVLIIEDNHAVAFMLGKLVEKLWKCQVTIAADGPAGIAEARRVEPRVVFCDIGLPGMSGHQVVGELRGMPELTRTVMVALTGYGEDEDRAQALAAGFDLHFVKPVSVALLQTVLQHPLLS